MFKLTAEKGQRRLEEIMIRDYVKASSDDNLHVIFEKVIEEMNCRSDKKKNCNLCEDRSYCCGSRLHGYTKECAPYPKSYNFLLREGKCLDS